VAGAPPLQSLLGISVRREARATFRSYRACGDVRYMSAYRCLAAKIARMRHLTHQITQESHTGTIVTHVQMPSPLARADTKRNRRLLPDNIRFGMYVNDNIVICPLLTADCPGRAQDAVFPIPSKHVRRCPGNGFRGQVKPLREPEERGPTPAGRPGRRDTRR
jgi:hypothetical protein